MCAKPKELFDYDKNEEFPVKLTEWIGDVFYDSLPEHGYQVRDEQIYTAFQIAEAFCNKKVHLAEAGLGTGKTFAYLLCAMAYARFTGKPVVIACASTALQEQLSGPSGDIQTLSNILGVAIDARMAKNPRQYVCDIKVDDYKSMHADKDSTTKILQWLQQTHIGERSEMPDVPDEVWKHIGWDESMCCESCTSRGYCKGVKARQYYRAAKDMIVVDHEVFFDDLWTRQQRLAEGKLALLPSYSAVIFDEGHKVLVPAAMRAGQYLIKEEIDTMTLTFEEIQGARDSLILAAIDLEEASYDFFEKLNSCVIADEASPRLAVRLDDNLLKLADGLNKALDRVLFEIQVEQGLYTDSLPISQLQIYEAQIERAQLALARLCRDKGKNVITWVDKKDGSLWVVPKDLSKMLQSHLFHNGLPVIFTSATLSSGRDFSYFLRTLGLKKASTSVVGSAFDIEQQVVVHLPARKWENNQSVDFAANIETLVSLLKLNEGRALVLTNSLEEVRKIKTSLKCYTLPFEVLSEDQAEQGYIVRKFRNEVSSVLIAANLWEGIDVPGESLSLVIIWQLPFPSLDPLIEAQRKDAKAEGLDPFITVDYPEMGLKLKQGCGRLIRTEQDRGKIIIMQPVKGAPWEKVVISALPPCAQIRTIEELLDNTKCGQNHNG